MCRRISVVAGIEDDSGEETRLRQALRTPLSTRVLIEQRLHLVPGDSVDNSLVLAGMDLVTREEFEAVKAMAGKARAEQEDLARRVAELEGAIAAIRERETPSIPPISGQA